MVLPIERSLREGESPYVFSLEEQWLDMEFREELIRFAGPVQVQGVVTNQEGRMMLTGSVSIQCHAVCARCLKPDIAVIDIPVEEMFLKEGMKSQTDSENYWYSADTLCLDEMIREQILLNYPMQQICRPDCQGLCPVCGIDLNEGQCSCPVTDDNPFAVLRDYFIDSQEGNEDGIDRT